MGAVLKRGIFSRRRVGPLVAPILLGLGMALLAGDFARGLLAQAVVGVESTGDESGNESSGKSAPSLQARPAIQAESPAIEARKVVPHPQSAAPTEGGAKEEPKPESSGDASKRPESSGEKSNADAAGSVVNRPTEPESPPNPEELKVRPDSSGRVRVNFRNQPWPKIMEWLADISGMSLDWRELPGDYLNLVTRDSYTVEEMRDLINQHLFHRGFTMIRRGEVIMVVNLEKVDPGLVPRVSLEDLDHLPDFDFVRVSLVLDWILAEKAAEEFKAYLSPRGKLIALPTTNRIEAMDAVVNLRELARLLREEQSPKGQERLVREFVLQFARAEETAKQLEDLLGTKQRGLALPPGMNPQQLQQMQQAMMAAQQQMQQIAAQSGNPATPGKGLPGFATPSDFNLVVNKRLHCRAGPARQDGDHRTGRQDSRCPHGRWIVSLRDVALAGLPFGGGGPGTPGEDLPRVGRIGSLRADRGR